MEPCEDFRPAAEELCRLAADLLRVELDDRQLEQFVRYYETLVAWNRRLNLTRITAPHDVAVKHFLDSLTCLPALPSAGERLRVIDVGAGAGFPGVPLKIVRPELHLTLLDSAAKKTAFLGQLVASLGLRDVAAVHGRAEQLGREAGHREGYDVAVSRAVAPLGTLAEYCLPFVQVGGRFVALKTSGIEQELRQAAKGIGLLGGRLVEQRLVTLPGLDLPRLLVVVEKARPTPEAYPRRAGTPEKQPLGGRTPSRQVPR